MTVNDYCWSSQWAQGTWPVTGTMLLTSDRLRSLLPCCEVPAILPVSHTCCGISLCFSFKVSSGVF